MNRKQNVAQARIAIVFVLLAICGAGCGPPRAAPQNLPLIASLRTALSAQNQEWLEQNAKILDERRGAGQVSDQEFAEFQSIIEKARADQWKEAETQAIAFQKAQRPTRDQIERVTRPGQ
jgi:hypothetical protein